MNKEDSYIMYTSKSAPGWWEQRVFDRLTEYLGSRGLNITAKKEDTFLLKYYRFFKIKIIIRHYFAIIQNSNTGNFYVLECHDRARNIPFFSLSPRVFARDPRCVICLKCQYRKKYFNKYPFTKIKPWTYFEANYTEIQPHLKALRKKKRIHKSLYFRGETRNRRSLILAPLKKKGIINLDSHHISIELYLKEICRHKILLALPGMGNVCHREIEGFGVGTPVLMPLLKNSFHNELIPDYHYISVDIDTQKDNAKYMADRLEERFRQIIDDTEYLDFVAKNAMKWYDENVRFPGSLELTAKLLGLKNE